MNTVSRKWERRHEMIQKYLLAILIMILSIPAVYSAESVGLDKTEICPKQKVSCTLADKEAGWEYVSLQWGASPSEGTFSASTSEQTDWTAPEITQETAYTLKIEGNKRKDGEEQSFSASATVTVKTPVIEVSVNPNAIPADGSTQSQITVTVKTSDGTGLDGLAVDVSTDLGTIDNTQGATSGGGKFICNLKSSDGGIATISASSNGATSTTTEIIVFKVSIDNTSSDKTLVKNEAQPNYADVVYTIDPSSKFTPSSVILNVGTYGSITLGNDVGQQTYSWDGKVNNQFVDCGSIQLTIKVEKEGQSITSNAHTIDVIGVQITDPEDNKLFPLDKIPLPIKFTAETNPKGFENYIQWVCNDENQTQTGSGSAFTPQFNEDGVKTVTAKIVVTPPTPTTTGIKEQKIKKDSNQTKTPAQGTTPPFSEDASDISTVQVSGYQVKISSEGTLSILTDGVSVDNIQYDIQYTATNVNVTSGFTVTEKIPASTIYGWLKRDRSIKSSMNFLELKESFTTNANGRITDFMRALGFKPVLLSGIYSQLANGFETNDKIEWDYSQIQSFTYIGKDGKRLPVWGTIKRNLSGEIIVSTEQIDAKYKIK